MRVLQSSGSVTPKQKQPKSQSASFCSETVSRYPLSSQKRDFLPLYYPTPLLPLGTAQGILLLLPPFYQLPPPCNFTDTWILRTSVNPARLCKVSDVLFLRCIGILWGLDFILPISVRHFHVHDQHCCQHLHWRHRRVLVWHLLGLWLVPARAIATGLERREQVSRVLRRL